MLPLTISQNSGQPPQRVYDIVTNPTNVMVVVN
jgi:hypothetical protein